MRTENGHQSSGNRLGALYKISGPSKPQTFFALAAGTQLPVMFSGLEMLEGTLLLAIKSPI